MNHLNEEQLVLHYYGEPGDAPPVEAHLAECQSCRAAYQSLQCLLNTVDVTVPQRPEDYGAQVWQRLNLPLHRPQARFWLLPRNWAMAAAAAVLLVAAFLAGRWQRPASPPPQVAVTGRLRERVLLVALGDHLERSQMILVELANATPELGRGGGRLDISYERSAAEDLLEANRLYRQTAQRTGDAAAANILDDLERTLLEIAHSPSNVSQTQLADLRKQIEDQGILFKVRIFGSRVREREAPVSAANRNL
ncbi:MAG: hypothetical protein ABI165_10730 [Bryobacteraceae bacterium]